MFNYESFIGRLDEEPLDSYPADGGFVGVLRTIACVGDSLSSGEFEAVNTITGNRMYMDRFDHSWGQHIARMAGCTVYNFSRGGMTAKEYNENFGNLMGYFRPELAANAYIIALGVNDLLNRGMEVGSADDICLEDWRKNADTFTGHYAAIIQRYKKIRPEAKFFLVNFPRPQAGAPEARVRASAEHDAALRKLCEIFTNTYLIDLRTYGPDMDAAFRAKFYLGGHLAPSGYLLMGKIFVSYLDYIIRHNFEAFRTVGLHGIEYETTDGTEKNIL